MKNCDLSNLNGSQMLHAAGIFTYIDPKNEQFL